MKHSVKKKSPSRLRYEQKHPVRSCRLDRKTDESLIKHLADTGRSFSQFVKDSLEKEQSMIEERIQTLAAQQINPSVEEKVRCLEEIVRDIYLLSVDYHRFPPYCPRCDNQEMLMVEGREINSRLAHPEVITFKCPKCGYFLNTYKGIDPKSISYRNINDVKQIGKSKSSVKRKKKKQ